MSGPGEIESVLTRFHQWLDEVRDEAAGPASDLNQEAQRDEGRPFGLVDLVEEFTALRHELKLQTKSARGLQEQAESLLPPLRQAIEHFRSVAPQEEQAAWSAGKPLALGLATLDEALDRCRREIDKARIVALEQTPRKLGQALDRLHASRHWYRRWRLRWYHRQVKELVEREAQGINLDWFESLLEGFDVIQNRVRKALKSEAIEPIACVGQPVDPDRMIVVEVTDAPDWPPGTVIEELRRGYTWRGRILRLAEVRAVRGQRIETHAEPAGVTDPELVDSELPHASVHEPPGGNGSRPTWLETE